MANAYIHDHAYVVRSVTVPAHGAVIKVWRSDSTVGNMHRYVYDLTYRGVRKLSATTKDAKVVEWLSDIDDSLRQGIAVVV